MRTVLQDEEGTFETETLTKQVIFLTGTGTNHSSILILFLVSVVIRPEGRGDRHRVPRGPRGQVLSGRISAIPRTRRCCSGQIPVWTSGNDIC